MIEFTKKTIAFSWSLCSVGMLVFVACVLLVSQHVRHATVRADQAVKEAAAANGIIVELRGLLKEASEELEKSDQVAISGSAAINELRKLHTATGVENTTVEIETKIKKIIDDFEICSEGSKPEEEI